MNQHACVIKPKMMFVLFVAVSGMELSPGKIIRCSCMFVQKSHHAPVYADDRPLVAQKCIFFGGSLFSSAGEVTAIVIGVMCGCVGLAVVVRFIVKTIR